MKHTIQVCTRCNFTKTEEEKNGVRGGAQLMERLLKKFEKSPVFEDYTVASTGCMGACRQACIIAFQSPGKISWVFGDLNPRFSVPSIIEFAEKYHASENGMIRYAERPPEMQSGLVTRMHPLDVDADEPETTVCAINSDVDKASEDPSCS